MRTYSDTYPMTRRIYKIHLNIVRDRRAMAEAKFLLYVHVPKPTAGTNLLDFVTYLDVHVGPFDGFLEGLCDLNA